MSTSNPSRQRLLWLIALLGIIAICIGAWTWAGYEPHLRLDNQKLAPLAFTPQGDVLAAGTHIQDGMNFKPVSPVRFLRSADGTEAEPPLTTLVVPLQGNPPIPREIIRTEFSPDGKLIAVLQEHHDFNRPDELELLVFARDTREPLAIIPVPHTANAADKASALPRGLFSPDSKWLLWVEYPFTGRSVKVWDLAGKKEAYTLPKVCYPVVSPDSTLIATTHFWRTLGKEPFAVQLWDIHTGALRQTLPLQGTSEGWKRWPSFSPNGRLLAVNSRDNNGKQIVEVFETTTGKRVFQQDAWSPHLLPDGKTLVTVKDNDVQLWDTSNWTLRGKSDFRLGKHWENGQDIPPEPIAIPGKSIVMVADYYPSFRSPTLTWLGDTLKLNAFGSHQITFVDGPSGQRQAVVLHHDSLLSNVVFSPEGSKAALGGIHGSLSLWEIPPHKSHTVILWAAALGTIVIGLALVLLRRGFNTARKD